MTRRRAPYGLSSFTLVPMMAVIAVMQLSGFEKPDAPPVSGLRRGVIFFVAVTILVWAWARFNRSYPKGGRR